MKTGWYLAMTALVLSACAVLPYKVQPKYDHPFFHTKSWSYAWFMIEDDNGKLSTTMSDSAGNEIMDTTRFYHTAHCLVNNTEDHVIHYARADLKDDSLCLYIAEGTASTNDHLLISINDGKLSTSYSTVYFFYYQREDVSWTTIRQHLILNQPTFRVGDTLKGEIDFACIEHWKKQPQEMDWQHKDDTLYIKGPFKCVLEKR